MSVVDSFASDVEVTRPRRVRTPRKSGVRASSVSDEGTPRPLDRPTAKSRDASLSKLSVYIPVETLKKLDVATVILDKDKSEIIAELLDAKFSGVTYYDRNATRSSAPTLLVSEIDSDPTA
jgi:hypothetical protein